MSRREESPSAADDETVVLQRIEQHKQDIKGGLARAAALCEQTVAIGGVTNEELARQGDTIDCISSRLDDTNDSMDRADHLIASIGSVWAAMNPFRKKKKTKKAKEMSLAAQRQAATADTRDIQKKEKVKAMATRGGYAAAVSDGAAARQDAADMQGTSGLDAEDQRTLTSIGHSLGVLKSMSLGLGGELDRQNARLDELDPKLKAVRGRIKKSTQNVEKIL
eukprot:TRINITY_DN5445_c1_g1_i1.p2 TRINITY_DN5445_c1_g1~~TRINITY_DN5445_c1_g1_i1.p2  ORF type:complete len:222 (+),score=94.53 TRINITY_DN5445_c1_g1_i1:55-720(+)